MNNISNKVNSNKLHSLIKILTMAILMLTLENLEQCYARHLPTRSQNEGMDNLDKLRELMFEIIDSSNEVDDTNRAIQQDSNFQHKPLKARLQLAHELFAPTDEDLAQIFRTKSKSQSNSANALNSKKLLNGHNYYDLGCIQC